MYKDQIYFWNRYGLGYSISNELYPDGFPVFNGTADAIIGPSGNCTTQLIVRPHDANDLMKALWFADAMAYRGKPIDNLVIPYLPGARQDRMNDAGDFLFAAKSIAEEINIRNFLNVVCFDPHSEVMPALINNCRVIHVDEADIEFGIKCYDGVVAPDAGAAKRAEAIAKTLKVPVYNAWKTRDIASGNSKITGFGIENISGVQKLLIVDDICDGGGTFIGLANHIKSMTQSYEIELDLYVSHGLFTKGITALEELFETIITTDTVQPRGIDVRPIKLKTIPIVDTLVEKGSHLV